MNFYTKVIFFLKVKVLKKVICPGEEKQSFLLAKKSLILTQKQRICQIQY